MPVMEVEVRYGARHGNGETLSVKRGETLGELEKGMEEGRGWRKGGDTSLGNQVDSTTGRPTELI